MDLLRVAHLFGYFPSFIPGYIYLCVDLLRVSSLRKACLVLNSILWQQYTLAQLLLHYFIRVLYLFQVNDKQNDSNRRNSLGAWNPRRRHLLEVLQKMIVIVVIIWKLAILGGVVSWNCYVPEHSLSTILNVCLLLYIFNIL